MKKAAVQSDQRRSEAITEIGINISYQTGAASIG
jgi:hypothetical protein